MKATRFEELEIWKRARMLAKSIYTLVKTSGLLKDYGLKDQIQRAAVSVGSNIAEGFERNSNKEFVNFLFIAKGSCGEVRSQLYTAYDVGQITDAQLNLKTAVGLGRFKHRGTEAQRNVSFRFHMTTYDISSEEFQFHQMGENQVRRFTIISTQSSVPLCLCV